MKISEFEKQPWVTAVNNSGLNLIDCFIDIYGYECTTPDKEAVTNVGSTYRLHIITKGCVHFTQDNKTVKLYKNSCFILDPTKYCSFQPDRSNPAHYYWVSFNGREAKNILQQIGFNAHCLYLHLSSDLMPAIRRTLFKNFQLSTEEKPISNFIFMENFYALARLLRQAQPQENENGSSKKSRNDYMERALVYFKEHYTEPDFTISDVAKHVHLHKNYFSSLFKSEIGVPFSSYLADKRIVLAVSLIRQGQTSVVKLAESVGIPDPSYFTKVFKKYNHNSPSEEIHKNIFYTI